MKVDISDEDQVNSGMDSSVKHLGGIDVLINAAGVAPHCPAEKISSDDWDSIFDINAKGTFLTNKAAFPYMKDTGGNIINFTSASVFIVSPGQLPATLTDAGIYVLDAKGLHQYEINARKKGRPWDPETAWAAFLTLEGDADTGLSYHRERRLKIKLAEITAEALVSLSRKRMTSACYSISPLFADDVGGQVSLSGAASPYAALLGLASSPSSEIDGYVFGSIEEIERECFLIPDTNGTCILRKTHGIPEKLKGLDAMPPIVVVADLATSVDDRERRCGLDYLERKLDEYCAH